MHIGTVEINSQLALAPMAGVTDAAFRQICSELGAGYTITELISSKALCYHDKKTFSLLTQFPGEHPAAVQIFGSDPICMAEAAQIAMEYSGADILDINMGCPMGKIVNNGDGAALMKDPEKAGRIVEAVVKALPGIPVTAKFRRGWDLGHCNCVEFARTLEQAGASAVAVPRAGLRRHRRLELHPGREGSRLHPRHRQRRHLEAGGRAAHPSPHRGGHGHDRPGLLRQSLDLPAGAGRSGREAAPPAAAAGGAVRNRRAADPYGRRL